HGPGALEGEIVFPPMIVPSSLNLLEPLPGIPADEVLAVGAVDRPLVEAGPVELVPELPRPHDVGLEVEHPVPRRNLVESPLDHPRLVERTAPAVLLGEHVVDRVPAAHAPRLLVVRDRDDHPVVEQVLVLAGGDLEEVTVADADGDHSESHGSSL